MAMKLTTQERLWVTSMQALLDACPSDRIGFYTIGDSQVSLYDRRKEDKINEIMDNSNSDFGRAVQKAKADIIEQLDFPALVHSVAG